MCWLWIVKARRAVTRSARKLSSSFGTLTPRVFTRSRLHSNRQDFLPSPTALAWENPIIIQPLNYPMSLDCPTVDGYDWLEPILHMGIHEHYIAGAHLQDLGLNMTFKLH